jgi:hypothetical protein
MAQNVAAVKSNCASQASVLAAALIKLCNQATEFDAEYFANGFNSGGSNPIVQADLDAGNSTNTFLTPTIIGNVVTQLQLLNSTFLAANLNQLRQAVVTPVV